eukprot:6250226-Alexandrium_andersonii.AAC.1
MGLPPPGTPAAPPRWAAAPPNPSKRLRRVHQFGSGVSDSHASDPRGAALSRARYPQWPPGGGSCAP